MSLCAIDGQPMATDRARRVGFGRLEIMNVDVSDEGVYRCSVPESSFVSGSPSISTEVQLSVVGKSSSVSRSPSVAA